MLLFCLVNIVLYYLKIHLSSKSIVTRESISSMEAKLPYHDFLRIHRSYIVSIPKIESFTIAPKTQILSLVDLLN